MSRAPWRSAAGSAASSTPTSCGADHRGGDGHMPGGVRPRPPSVPQEHQSLPPQHQLALQQQHNYWENQRYSSQSPFVSGSTQQAPHHPMGADPTGMSAPHRPAGPNAFSAGTPALASGTGYPSKWRMPPASSEPQFYSKNGHFESYASGSVVCPTGAGATAAPPIQSPGVPVSSSSFQFGQTGPTRPSSMVASASPSSKPPSVRPTAFSHPGAPPTAGSPLDGYSATTPGSVPPTSQTVSGWSTGPPRAPADTLAPAHSSNSSTSSLQPRGGGFPAQAPANVTGADSATSAVAAAAAALPNSVQQLLKLLAAANSHTAASPGASGATAAQSLTHPRDAGRASSRQGGKGPPSSVSGPSGTPVQQAPPRRSQQQDFQSPPPSTSTPSFISSSHAQSNTLTSRPINPTAPASGVSQNVLELLSQLQQQAQSQAPHTSQAPQVSQHAPQSYESPPPPQSSQQVAQFSTSFYGRSSPAPSELTYEKEIPSRPPSHLGQPQPYGQQQLQLQDGSTMPLQVYSGSYSVGPTAERRGPGPLPGPSPSATVVSTQSGTGGPPMDVATMARKLLVSLQQIVATGSGAESTAASVSVPVSGGPSLSAFSPSLSQHHQGTAVTSDGWDGASRAPVGGGMQGPAGPLSLNSQLQALLTKLTATSATPISHTPLNFEGSQVARPEPSGGSAEAVADFARRILLQHQLSVPNTSGQQSRCDTGASQSFVGQPQVPVNSTGALTNEPVSRGPHIIEQRSRLWETPRSDSSSRGSVGFLCPPESSGGPYAAPPPPPLQAQQHHPWAPAPSPGFSHTAAPSSAYTPDGGPPQFPEQYGQQQQSPLFLEKPDAGRSDCSAGKGSQDRRRVDAGLPPSYHRGPSSGSSAVVGEQFLRQRSGGPVDASSSTSRRQGDPLIIAPGPRVERQSRRPSGTPASSCQESLTHAALPVFGTQDKTTKPGRLSSQHAGRRRTGWSRSRSRDRRRGPSPPRQSGAADAQRYDSSRGRSNGRSAAHTHGALAGAPPSTGSPLRRQSPPSRRRSSHSQRRRSGSRQWERRPLSKGKTSPLSQPPSHHRKNSTTTTAAVSNSDHGAPASANTGASALSVGWSPHSQVQPFSGTAASRETENAHPHSVHSSAAGHTVSSRLSNGMTSTVAPLAPQAGQINTDTTVPPRSFNPPVDSSLSQQSHSRFSQDRPTPSRTTPQHLHHHRRFSPRNRPSVASSFVPRDRRDGDHAGAPARSCWQEEGGDRQQRLLSTEDPGAAGWSKTHPLSSTLSHKSRVSSTPPRVNGASEASRISVNGVGAERAPLLSQRKASSPKPHGATVSGALSQQSQSRHSSSQRLTTPAGSFSSRRHHPHESTDLSSKPGRHATEVSSGNTVFASNEDQQHRPESSVGTVQKETSSSQTLRFFKTTGGGYSRATYYHSGFQSSSENTGGGNRGQKRAADSGMLNTGTASTSASQTGGPSKSNHWAVSLPAAKRGGGGSNASTGSNLMADIFLEDPAFDRAEEHVRGLSFETLIQTREQCAAFSLVTEISRQLGSTHSDDASGSPRDSNPVIPMAENIMPTLWVWSSLRSLRQMSTSMRSSLLSNASARVVERCLPGLLMTGLPNVNVVALQRALSMHYKAFRVPVGKFIFPVYPDTGYSMGWCVVEPSNWASIPTLLRAQQFQWRGMCVKLRPLPCPHFLQLNASLAFSAQRSKAQGPLNVSDWRPAMFKDFADVIYPRLQAEATRLLNKNNPVANVDLGTDSAQGLHEKTQQSTIVTDTFHAQQQVSPLCNPTPCIVICSSRRVHLSVPVPFPSLLVQLPAIFEQNQPCLMPASTSSTAAQQLLMASTTSPPSATNANTLLLPVVQNPCFPSLSTTGEGPDTSIASETIGEAEKLQEPIPSSLPTGAAGMGHIIPPAFLTTVVSGVTLDSFSSSTAGLQQTPQPQQSLVASPCRESGTFCEPTNLCQEHKDMTPLVESKSGDTASLHQSSDSIAAASSAKLADASTSPLNCDENVNAINCDPLTQEKGNETTSGDNPVNATNSQNCVAHQDVSNNATNLATLADSPLSQNAPTAAQTSTAAGEETLTNTETSIKTATAVTTPDQPATATITAPTYTEISTDITPVENNAAVRLSNISHLENPSGLDGGDMDMSQSDDESSPLLSSRDTVLLQSAGTSATLYPLWAATDSMGGASPSVLGASTTAAGYLPPKSGTGFSTVSGSTGLSRGAPVTPTSLIFPPLPNVKVDGEDATVKPIAKEEELGYFSLFSFGNHALLALDFLSTFVTDSDRWARSSWLLEDPEYQTGQFNMADLAPWTSMLDFEREGLDCSPIRELLMNLCPILKSESFAGHLCNPFAYNRATVPEFEPLPFLLSIRHLPNGVHYNAYVQKQLDCAFIDAVLPQGQNGASPDEALQIDKIKTILEKEMWGSQCYRFAETRRLRGDGFLLLPSCCTSAAILGSANEKPLLSNCSLKEEEEEERAQDGLHEPTTSMVITETKPQTRIVWQPLLITREELRADLWLLAHCFNSITHALLECIPALSEQRVETTETDLFRSSPTAPTPQEWFDTLPALHVLLEQYCVWLEKNSANDSTNNTGVSLRNMLILQQCLGRLPLEHSLCTASHFVKTYFFTLDHFLSMAPFVNCIRCVTNLEISSADGLSATDSSKNTSQGTLRVLITPNLRQELEALTDHALPALASGSEYRAFCVYRSAFALISSALDMPQNENDDDAVTEHNFTSTQLERASSQVSSAIVDLLTQYIEHNFTQSKPSTENQIKPKKKPQVIQWLVFEDDPDWQASARIPSMTLTKDGAMGSFKMSGDISSSTAAAKLSCALKCLKYMRDLEARMLQIISITEKDASTRSLDILEIPASTETTHLPSTATGSDLQGPAAVSNAVSTLFSHTSPSVTDNIPSEWDTSDVPGIPKDVSDQEKASCFVYKVTDLDTALFENGTLKRSNTEHYWTIDRLYQLHVDRKFRFLPVQWVISTPRHKYTLEHRTQHHFRSHEKVFKWALQHDYFFQPKDEDYILSQFHNDQRLAAAAASTSLPHASRTPSPSQPTPSQVVTASAFSCLFPPLPTTSATFTTTTPDLNVLSSGEQQHIQPTTTATIVGEKTPSITYPINNPSAPESSFSPAAVAGDFSHSHPKKDAALPSVVSVPNP